MRCFLKATGSLRGRAAWDLSSEVEELPQVFFESRKSLARINPRGLCLEVGLPREKFGRQTPRAR